MARLFLRNCRFTNQSYSKWLTRGFFLILIIYVYVIYTIFFNHETINKYTNNLHNGGKDKQLHIQADKFVKLNFSQAINDIEVYRKQRFEKAANRPKDIQGPGEDGKGVVLTPEELERVKEIFEKEAYNVIASSKVAMDRRLKDIRHPDCLNRHYPSDLPSASVVIIFCEESPSGLLRTVHSVVNRSPPQYLREVILVDDFSQRADLGKSLEEYIATTWPDGIVKLTRSSKRLGLIRAKIYGGELATGDVLVFLDAHCEANDYWLEPILARIQEKPNVVVCPAVDLIDDKTLEYSLNGGISVGGFTWSLHFTWRSIPERDRKARKSDADPVMSPTMAGGLLAAGREFFFQIGSYDPGMYTWGGENLELSFRTWMCGGELEFIPCSRVGHIFRARHPFNFDHQDSHGYNSKRLAEVWMDDYKRLFYQHRRDLVDSDAGNLTERKQLREKLQCKSFKWFLDNVFPEQFIIDENSQAHGMLKNPVSGLCLDSMSRNSKTRPNIGLYHCSQQSYNQLFGLSQINELRMEEVCADAIGSPGAFVRLYDCHELRGNQEWHYDPKTKMMKHASGFCLDTNNQTVGSDVKLDHCKGGANQQWEFQHVIKFN